MSAGVDCVAPCADVLPVVGEDEAPIDGGEELTAEVEQEVERVVALPPLFPSNGAVVPSGPRGSCA